MFFQNSLCNLFRNSSIHYYHQKITFIEYFHFMLLHPQFNLYILIDIFDYFSTYFLNHSLAFLNHFNFLFLHPYLLLNHPRQSNFQEMITIEYLILFCPFVLYSYLLNLNLFYLMNHGSLNALNYKYPLRILKGRLLSIKIHFPTYEKTILLLFENFRQPIIYYRKLNCDFLYLWLRC
jgi:hypothetical protein